MAAGWVCAVCGRKVPGYVHTCHCGAGRPAQPPAGAARPAPRPAAAAAWRLDPRDFTWQVWLALGVMVLVLVGALVSLFLPYERERVVPLLGYADHVPEPPATTPPAPAKPSPTARPGAPGR